ncbi:hypothetical protein DPMN_000989 [Dreissena polymorpha]|uniref:Uncharacterized protein n=1 Tax=Dreissena polymorpha TaxID=45954 RepID=A0A9D4MGF8_DREPO|nr:hypothetical protein DPMN_000989 [Dreissena polymorpha]
MAPNVLVVFEGTRRLDASARRVDTRRLRLVHVTECHYTCTSGNTPPGKYVLKHTVTGLHTHILLGIHFQGNTCH